MSARKAHNTGRNHVANVRDYFASLGHDKAQNIIDAIIQSHESGGRAQMMAAPSMRLGAGFMNPIVPSESRIILAERSAIRRWKNPLGWGDFLHGKRIEPGLTIRLPAFPTSW